jgi:hypothetical protein
MPMSARYSFTSFCMAEGDDREMITTIVDDLVAVITEAAA